ncbi:HAD family hydrolase [Qipengyuania sp.]|uniref:sulfotransferase-like domain-containing protein n=1 Tax=Qipengyuania sp. TaxID=2004515 RepID=UPI003AF76262
MTVRIAMWSGPRNISTAMMRSFGARADCAVSDEPFYGAFLAATGEPHPLAAETIADMDCDWHSVLRRQSCEAPGDKPIWYQKHMPHHMVGPVSVADMPDHRHAFLIRAPERVVASYRQKIELREPEMLGFAQLRAYFEAEAGRTGALPPVVDSDDILADPAAVLEKLCHALGIDWDPAMLSWAPGPHAEDGVWGAHWYDRVNASTGFAPPPADLPELEGDYARVAEACRADYEALKRYALC